MSFAAERVALNRILLTRKLDAFYPMWAQQRSPMADKDNGMRGAGLQAVIAAQRADTTAGERRSRFGLMVPEAFVRGIRDLGYRSNGDAIAELIEAAVRTAVGTGPG